MFFNYRNVRVDKWLICAVRESFVLKCVNFEVPVSGANIVPDVAARTWEENAVLDTSVPCENPFYSNIVFFFSDS